MGLTPGMPRPSPPLPCNKRPEVTRAECLWLTPRTASPRGALLGAQRRWPLQQGALCLFAKLSRLVLLLCRAALLEREEAGGEASAGPRQWRAQRELALGAASVGLGLG